MGSGRITLDEVLGACERVGTVCEPVTASEVGEELGCTRRAALNKLDELAERGDIKSKKVGARSRVWWRPPDRSSGCEQADTDDALEPDSVTVEGSLADIRKRLEAELNEMFGRISDAFYALDDQWRFTYVNEHAEELIDYQGEGLVGKNLWEVFEWTSDSTLGEEYRTAMETQEPTSFEFYYPDPLDAWYEVHAYPSQTGLSVYFQDITDRVERKRELERSERRYRALVENFPNGAVALVDENLHYRTVGGNPLDVADVTAEEIEGRPVREALPPELADELVPRYEAAMEGESASFEAEYDDRIFEFQVVPVRDNDGDVFATLGMSQDITERKELEDELRATKERYQRLVEQNLLGIYLVQDGEIQYVNSRFAEIFGYTPEEMLSKTEPLDYVAPEDRDTVAENLRARQDGETDSAHYTFTGVRKDGERIELEVHGSQIEHQGDPAVLGTLLDVTERKQMEAELRRERDLKNQIVETSPVGIAVVGADGTVEFANDHAEDIYGRSRDELDEFAHDDPRLDLVDENGDPLETGEAPFDRVLAREEAIYNQVVGLRRPSGERVWVSVNGAPQWNEAGELERAVFAFEDITERRETQRQLEESEHRYRTLVEHFPNGAVGLFDEDLRYTAVGGELLDTLDLSPEERIGRPLSDIHSDDLLEEIEPYFRDALEGEANSFEVEYRGQHLSAHTVPVRNVDDEVDAGMLVVQDVTERQEAQRELRESEAKFRMLAENLDEIVWMTTADAEEFIYINPAFEEVWGLDREDLYDEPLSFLEAVHPDDRDRVRREFTALPEAEFDEEFRIVRSNGETRWVHARGSKVHSEDEEMTRIVGIGEDVTEQRERERELERALDLLERTERIADVGGWEIDVGTQDVFWTDHVFELLEVPNDEEPPLEEALDMYHEDDQSIVEEAVEDALNSGDPFDVEVRIRTGSGEIRWLRLQGVPETVDDEVVSFRGAAQDITERKERERELQERNERLDSFASMLAHELRNPVTIGQIYSQQLPEETDSEAVEYVTEAFDRIEDMIDVLLVLTRGREVAGKKQPVQLADAAREAWNKVDAPDATLEIEFDQTIQADETYVQHLIRNLFENAVQHGGADATITVGDLPTGFYVADDGAGIPADERDAVFEAGYTTATEQGGTGLGLAYVKELADVYEWEYTVTESATGGARFEFTNVNQDSPRN